MEGTLRVTPEQLRSAADQLSSERASVRSLTSEMMQQVTGLSAAWEGEAATAYMNQFKQLDDDMTRMDSMINEHITDLNQMAQVYSQAETANVEEAQALAGDVIV